MPLSPLMLEKLKRALNARRVALVGASQEQLSVGMGPVYNLLGASFQGEVIPVNPKYNEILGLKCYPDLESIDPPPDLAILLLNQHMALEMAERAAKIGIPAVTIVAGGFREVRSGGEALDKRLLELATRYEMVVIGPNTLGFSSFHHGLHAIFWHLDARPGPVAILSQSGGVGLSMAQSLQSLHCGLSHFIGLGNRTVLDFADYLEVLRDDPNAETFLLFVEGVEHPRSLYEALKKTALKKPVIIYKAGKNEEVSKATATHTGSLAVEYRLYQGMFKQAGAFEVQSAFDAAVAAKALSMLQAPRSPRMCALTFTAGPCIVAMDKLLGAGWELPDLSLEAKAKIGSIIGEKTPVELQNPVDLTGPGFLPQTYARVLEAVLQEDYDAYLIVWNYNPLIRPPIIEFESLAKKYADKTLVLVFMAHQIEAAPYMAALHSKGVCTYLTPEDGATALNALLFRYHFLKRAGAR
ncbi:MAG: CoA-binding protein [Syntrophobacteraceae bacterium]